MFSEPGWVRIPLGTPAASHCAIRAGTCGGFLGLSGLRSWWDPEALLHAHDLRRLHRHPATLYLPVYVRHLGLDLRMRLHQLPEMLQGTGIACLAMHGLNEAPGRLHVPALPLKREPEVLVCIVS